MPAELPDPNRNASSTEGDDELLVAYLDGELDVATRQRIEDQLANDAKYRVRLHHLQRSWDLLDWLPRCETDEVMTRTTLEMVAARSGLDTPRLAPTNVVARRWPRGLAVAASILISAMAGYSLVAGLSMRAYQRNLQELPLAALVQHGADVESMDFLDALYSKKVFMVDDAVDEAGSWDDLVLARNSHQIQTCLSQLVLEDQKLLQQLREQFSHMTPEDQDRLRSLRQGLLESRSPEIARRRQRIMDEYHRWLNERTPRQRAELKDQLLKLSSTGRAEEIAKQVHDEGRRAQDRHPTRPVRVRLTQPDRRALRQWAGEQLQWLREQRQQVSPESLEQLAESSAPGTWDPLLFFLKLGADAPPDGLKNTHLPRAFPMIWTRLMRLDPKTFGIQQAQVDRLADQLSAPAREKLQAAPDLAGQWQLIRQWLEEMSGPSRPHRRPWLQAPPPRGPPPSGPEL